MNGLIGLKKPIDKETLNFHEYTIQGSTTCRPFPKKEILIMNSCRSYCSNFLLRNGWQVYNGRFRKCIWENLEKQFALKSFLSLDNNTVKEIVNKELNLMYNTFFFLISILVQYIYFKILNFI